MHSFNLFSSKWVFSICLLAVIAVSSWLQIIHLLLVFMIGSIAFFTMVQKPVYAVYVLAISLNTPVLFQAEDGSTLTRLVGLGVFGIWLLSKLIQRESSIRADSISLTWLLASFVGLGALSILWSTAPSRSQTMLFTLVQLLGYFIIIVDTLRNTQHVLNFLVAYSLGSIFNSFALAVEFFNNRTLFARAEGLFLNENAAASAVMIILPFTLYLAFTKRGLYQMIGIIGFPICIVGISVSVSRSNIVLAIVGSTLFLLLFVMNSKQVKTSIIIPFILLFSVTLFAIQEFVPAANIERRFALVQGEFAAEGERLDRAINAIGFIGERPWGYGMGGNTPRGNYVIHNQILQAGVDMGLVGLILLLGIWTVHFYYLYHVVQTSKNVEPDIAQLCQVIGIMSLMYFFYSFTSSNYHSRLLWMLFALSSVIIDNTKHKRVKVATASKMGNPYQPDRKYK